MEESEKTSKKILVISGCSQKKLPNPAPAKDLNQGQLFRAIKKLTIQNQFGLKILSGKYGLLEPDQIIEPYNQRIKTKADIKRVREMVIPKIFHIWNHYNQIIIIMGKKYREVLIPFFDKKWIVVYDVRGIGGYKSLVAHYLKLSTSQLLQQLKKFQYIECAEYLSSISNLTPHCCNSCYYYKNDKCKFSELYPHLKNDSSYVSISYPTSSFS